MAPALLIGSIMNSDAPAVFLTLISIGVVAGLAAKRLFIEQKQIDVVTLVLCGIGGSCIGGVLGSLIHGDRQHLTLTAGAMMWAITCAVSMLAGLAVRSFRRKHLSAPQNEAA